MFWAPFLKKMSPKGVFALFMGIFPMTPLASAQEGAAVSFACLKSSMINVRKGPGRDHPIVVTYHAKWGWPVIIEKKKDNWYFIRDHDQVQGWVHGSMLKFKSLLVITTDALSPLRKKPSEQGKIIALLKARVLGRYLKSDPKKQWCLIEVNPFLGHPKAAQKLIRGWVMCNALWPSMEGS